MGDDDDKDLQLTCAKKQDIMEAMFCNMSEDEIQEFIFSWGRENETNE